MNTMLSLLTIPSSFKEVGGGGGGLGGEEQEGPGVIISGVSKSGTT